MATDKGGFPTLDIKAARALRPNVHQIRIDSVLGGRAIYSNYANDNQFTEMIGIDPTSYLGTNGYSGFLIPGANSTVPSTTEITDTPLWIRTQPKDGTTYVYGFDGSIYTLSNNGTNTVSPLTKLVGSKGNGAAYCDNYMYFATGSTVARYGPLNGAPAMNTDYWAVTLGKTGLADTTYPIAALSATVNRPNHVMLRHTDGALYFADVVGNQGVLHKISTTKTAVEGDTDNGSTYNAIDFPPGMYVTALCSSGDKIVVALYEGSNAAYTQQGRAKIAIWDPTNPVTYDSLTYSEFPDALITALLNTNGVIYTFSTNQITPNSSLGTRVMRLVSDHSFQQVAIVPNSISPYAGAVDGSHNRVVFGGTDGNTGVIWAIGKTESEIDNTISCPTISSSGGYVTAIVLGKQSNLSSDGGKNPLIGWGNGALGSGSSGIDLADPGGTSTSSPNAYYISKVYRLGAKFKITKVIIPMQNAFPSAARTLVVKIITDDFTKMSGPTTVATIDNTTGITGKYRYVFRPTGLVGDTSFALQLNWTGTQQYGVALPITIEYELIDD